MDQRDEQALTAVKLYYESGLSQAEVASELGVSRPTVAKLIAHGKDRGFVTIEIHDPREAGEEIAAQLGERFALHDVRFAYVPRNTPEDLTRELGRAGAEVLESVVDDGTSIGVSWGQTMNSVASQLSHHPEKHGVTVVQLKGGHSHSARSTHDFETLSRFCSAFNAEALQLPLPVIFDNVAAKQIVEQDRHIARILDAGRNTDVAIFTVGDVHPSSLLLNLGYLSPEETEALVDRAVGDCCSRFYTEEGGVALPEVNDRTVGISLADLAARPIRILVAGGAKKTAAISTALGMGLATHLVIDRDTARAVLTAAKHQPPRHL